MAKFDFQTHTDFMNNVALLEKGDYKMKLRRIVTVLLVTVLAAGLLCGCAESKSDNVLHLATSADFAPYEYYEGNEIVGIDIEIAQAIADYLGMELSVEDMDFNAVVPAVQNGKYDIGMAGLTVDETRKLVVSFTDTYATGVQAVIVPEDSPITSCDDLLNNIGKYKIGVQLATTGDILACDEFGMENVEEYVKGADAVLALTSGKIDAVIIDKQPAKAFIAANEGLKLLDTDYTVEDYAIIVSKSNTELLKKINTALSALKADGTIDTIIAKYIHAD